MVLIGGTNMRIYAWFPDNSQTDQIVVKQQSVAHLKSPQLPVASRAATCLTFCQRFLAHCVHLVPC